MEGGHLGKQHDAGTSIVMPQVGNPSSTGSDSGGGVASGDSSGGGVQEAVAKSIHMLPTLLANQQVRYAWCSL